MLRSSPFSHSGNTVRAVMNDVLLAGSPGVAACLLIYGWGVACQLAIVLAVALASESAALRWRGRDAAAWRDDHAIVVLALLLALTLPPYAPWWIGVLAALFAVLIGKHAYGGLGTNVFNPAMAGYVFVLVFFPAYTQQWPLVGAPLPGPGDSIAAVFAGAAGAVDALSGATALDHMQTNSRLMIMLSEMEATRYLGRIGTRGVEWINLAFLAGGVYLVLRRRIAWRVPAGMLLALFVTAALFNGYDPDRYAGPLFHLFSGATMIGAFFIATEPVSGVPTPRGQLCFGAGVGLLTWVVRSWGVYPDGVAIAIICMNALAPMLHALTQPRLVGGGEAP
ncbi:MAG: RnfABCDGE type electron transport complex subunit D [Gammaproteobacteria bacterium]|nr:RnfABCDGE type electron transport complex subunit D [Gammaproteobacteria bacterium]